jgi:DNA repair protein RecO
MALYRDEVIVLAARDVGEADRIYTFYGKRKGKFRAIAKGVRRMASRKRGHLGTFNVCRVLCAEGRSLDILSEAESDVLIDPTEMSNEELESVGLVAMVLNKLSADEDPDAGVFELGRTYLVGEHGDEETADVVCGLLLRAGFLSQEQRTKLPLEDSEKVEVLRRYVKRVLDAA